MASSEEDDGAGEGVKRFDLSDNIQLKREVMVARRRKELLSSDSENSEVATQYEEECVREETSSEAEGEEIPFVAKDPKKATKNNSENITKSRSARRRQKQREISRQEARKSNAENLEGESNKETAPKNQRKKSNDRKASNATKGNERTFVNKKYQQKKRTQSQSTEDGNSVHGSCSSNEKRQNSRRGKNHPRSRTGSESHAQVRNRTQSQSTEDGDSLQRPSSSKKSKSKDEQKWKNKDSEKVKKDKDEKSKKETSGGEKRRERTDKYKCQQKEKGNKTEVFVKIKGNVTNAPHLKDFLKNNIGQEIPFVVKDKQQCEDKNEGTVVIEVSSKQNAKKICQKLNEVPEEIGVRATLQKDFYIMAEDELEEYLDSQWTIIARKAEPFLIEHEGKMNSIQTQLNSKKRGGFVKLDDFEHVKEERLALESKLAELEGQIHEFGRYMQMLQKRLYSLEPNIKTKIEATVKLLRKAFASECGHLQIALPIYARRTDIIEIVRENQVCVILGETGSGKSTQMAQYLYQTGITAKGMIVCTQPRKVAAISLCSRVAEEMGTSAGDIVGYQIGMQMRKKATTRILYVTDHVLLNECLKDPTLSKYSCIIIDEAHERSIYTDLLLGMIKCCLKSRSDLKIIITSATIDPEVFVRYFEGCPVLKVSGRTFPVDVEWGEEDLRNDSRTIVEKAVQKAKEIHSKEQDGDVLVFMTTPLETEKACELFEKSEGKNNAMCVQLHGRLKGDEQQKVFQPPPPGKRKIVFATNSAETSITIPGIKYVVDVGFVKEKRFDPVKDMSSLVVAHINKSSAEQRKGRAGRIERGKCYRLYTQKTFLQMDDNSVPEILRVHLGMALLKLMVLPGVGDPLKFDFVESPSEECLCKAMDGLEEVGAVSEGNLTELGEKMAKLPVEPRLAKLILDGIDQNVAFESLIVGATCILSSNIFFRMGTDSEKQEADKKKTVFCDLGGDVLTLLNVYKEWFLVEEKKKNTWCVQNSINAKSMRTARDTIKELKDVLVKELDYKVKFEFQEDEDVTTVVLPKLVLACFKLNLCVFSGHEKLGYYMVLNPERSPLVVHPSSALVHTGNVPKWLVFEQVLKTSQEFMINTTDMKEEWIDEYVLNGKLKPNMDALEKKVVCPVDVAYLGKEMIYRFTGPKYSTLKSHQERISTMCDGVPVIIDVKRETGRLRLFIPKEFQDAGRTYLVDQILEERRKLQKVSLEEPLSSESKRKLATVRTVMKQGGEIDELLAPNEYRTVFIIDLPDEISEEKVHNIFQSNGEIETCVKFTPNKEGKKPGWGKITFRKCETAALVVKREREKIKVVPEGGSVTEVMQLMKVKVSWVRRPMRGFAFVDMHDPIDVVHAIMRGSIVIAGNSCSVKPNKKGTDTLFVPNIPKHARPELIERDIGHQITGIKRISLPREEVGETTKDDLDMMKRKLRLEVGRHTPGGEYELYLREPREKDFNMIGALSFGNVKEGEDVLTNLTNAVQFNGQTVNFQREYKASIHVTQDVFSLLEKKIKGVFKEMKQTNRGLDPRERKLKSGHFVIDILADDFESLSEAKVKIQNAVAGSPIDCDSSEKIKHLFTKSGQIKLDNIMKNTQTFINADYRTQNILVYGEELDIQDAKAIIDRYLEKMGETKVKEFGLRGEDKPPGLMKALLVKYGINLEALRIACQLDTIELLMKNHTLRVRGVDKAVSDLENKIEEAKQGLPYRPNADTDCPVCLCPLEGSVFVPECCDHPYCKECARNLVQNAIQSKDIPITCAADGCTQKLCIKDFDTLLNKKDKQCLQGAALDVYVAKSRDKEVKYCITADCPMVYKTTNPGKVFQCPICLNRICTSCHIQWHDGFTCGMYKGMKENPDYSLEAWLKSNTADRALCPTCKVPIEKIGGCPHMQCTKCRSHICWKCKKVLSSGDDTYDHMATCRGEP